MWDGHSVPAEAIYLIKEIEGFSSRPYDDNGVKPGGTWTIGFGATLDLNDQPVTRMTPPITEGQAIELLKRDLEGAVRTVRTVFTKPLAEHEAAALIVFAFNIANSPAGLRSEAPSLIRMITTGQKVAAANFFKEYRNQGGNPVLGLRRRRWAEAAVFLGMDAAEAKKTAWSRINTVDDWITFPVSGEPPAAAEDVSEADRLNQAQIDRFRRSESHG